MKHKRNQGLWRLRPDHLFKWTSLWWFHA